MPPPTPDAAPSAPTAARSRSLGGLFQHSVIYSLAPLLRSVVSLGMNRLYTTWLMAGGYGVKEQLELLMIAMQQLLGQNLLGGMVRFYFDQKDERDRNAVVSSCVVIVGLAAWLVCGLGLLFSDALRQPLLGSGDSTISALELSSVLQLTLVLIPFQLTSVCGFYYLMSLKRSELYTGIQTAKLVVEVFLNLLLMGVFDMGLRGFLWSMIGGELLVSLLLTGWTLRRVGTRIDWRVFRPIVIYALPLVPVGFAQFGLHQADRYLIRVLDSAQSGYVATGIYGLGYKLSYLVTALMLGPFIQIWQPWIFGVREAVERARLVARVSTYTMLAVGAVTMVVILFGRQGVLILANDPELQMRAAYKVVPLISTGYVFWALYKTTEIPLFIAKRTVRLLVINVLALVFNIAANLYLVPRYGYFGAAFATCATFGALSVMGMLASRSEAHVPFELGRILGILGVVSCSSALTLAIDSQLAQQANWDFFAAIHWKSLIGAAGSLALWFGVLRKEERLGARSWLLDRLSRRGNVGSA